MIHCSLSSLSSLKISLIYIYMYIFVLYYIYYITLYNYLQHRRKTEHGQDPPAMPHKMSIKKNVQSLLFLFRSSTFGRFLPLGGLVARAMHGVYPPLRFCFHLTQFKTVFLAKNVVRLDPQNC